MCMYIKNIVPCINFIHVHVQIYIVHVHDLYIHAWAILKYKISHYTFCYVFLSQLLCVHR